MARSAVESPGDQRVRTEPLQFCLHPFGPEVYFAAQLFALEDAPPVMRKWRDFVEAAGDEISSVGLLWTVPAVDGLARAIALLLMQIGKCSTG